MSPQTAPLSHPIDTHAIHFSVAEIIAKSDHHYVVKIAGHSVLAKTAMSFLFIPDIHDQVLLITTNEQYFINQILHRPSNLPLEFRIDNELMINAAHAAVIINAEQLHFTSQTTTLNTQALDSRADHVTLNWQQTDYQGQHCAIDLNSITLQANQCNSVIEHLTLKAKHVLQWISDLKQQMLGRLHISVQKHYQLDCESADIYSQRDVKIDASQIHLG